MRRYCSNCHSVRDHRVVEQGNLQRWLECVSCKWRTRAYDLRKRSWAGF